MEREKLKHILITEAKDKGICSQGLGIMENSGIDQLIEYYKQTIDWSLERGFPSFRTLVFYFADLDSKGIFVNRTFDGEVFSKQQVYVFHNCQGSIKIEMDYDNAVIPILYFDNNCEMTVTCTQKRNKSNPIKVTIYSAESRVIPVASKYAEFNLHKINRI